MKSAGACSSTPALWPTIPDDATFASVFEAARRYTGTPVEKAATRFLGLKLFQGDLFAVNAKAFAERIPGEPTTPEMIVLRHSPFRFYSSFLTLQDEGKWLAAIVEQDRATIRTLAPATRVGRINANGLRQCSACMLEDVHRFGIEHWHVAHQIPALRRCPWHRLELHDRCSECGASLAGGRLLTMPGDPCRCCGSRSTCSSAPHQAVSAYAGFEALVMRALGGNAPELRPQIRVALADRVVHRRSGTRGLPDVVQRFLAAWSAETAVSLGQQLDCVATEPKLFGLFAGVETATARTLQAAAVSFMLEHASSEDLEACSSGEAIRLAPEDLFSQPAAVGVDEVLLKALCAAAMTHGYPIEGARALSAGATPKTVATKGLAAPNVTRRFLSRLPVDVFLKYETHARRRTETRRSTLGNGDHARFEVRRRIIEAIEKGCKTRERLYRVAFTAHQWALQHDLAWLDERLPKLPPGRKKRLVPPDRDVVRGLIQGAVLNGLRTRKELKRQLYGPYAWALRNDRQWLDTTFPARPRSA